MPIWAQVLLGVVGTFIVLSIFLIVGTKLDKAKNDSNENKKMPKQIVKKEKCPVTADTCANRAIIIFNIFLIVNAVGAVAGVIVSGCYGSLSGILGCLIDFVAGTLGLLLFKYCWQSLFLVVKEK